jgi:hypothetical protein
LEEITAGEFSFGCSSAIWQGQSCFGASSSGENDPEFWQQQQQQLSAG